MALIPNSDLACQSPDQTVFRLNKINVAGAAIYTRDQVIDISGLKVGQSVRLADLGAAADLLTASGLFRSVAYRYAYTGADVDVTLEVTEDKLRATVVFDNFIKFKDQELVAAIRRELTWFDGASPASTGALNAIKQALQRFLQQNNVVAEVDHTSQTDLYGRGRLEIFSIRGDDFPVCAVEFQGVASDRLSEIRDKSKALLKGVYSRAFASAFVSGNLIPVYRSKGYLRARFQDPQAAMSSDSKCGRGVILSLTVDEGNQYTWLKAEWSGNKSLSSGELDETLKMTGGEVANGLKIDSGLVSVREAYGKRGYLGVRVSSDADYDDREHRVAFRVAVDEGPQYHMGQIVLTGLPDREAARVKARWKLAEGAVFDTSYFKEFVTKELSGESLDGARRFEVSSRPDRQTLKVNITIAAASTRSKS
jgi:outer membrane protein assembly factor BamA